MPARPPPRTGQGSSSPREKRVRRASDEQRRALADYRATELERMRMNFYGFDPSYHIARHRFVYRTPHAWTPLHLARASARRPHERRAGCARSAMRDAQSTGGSLASRRPRAGRRFQTFRLSPRAPPRAQRLGAQPRR